MRVFPKLRLSGLNSPISRLSDLIVVSALCLTVVACGPSGGGRTTNQVALDILPARVCVTSETTDAITKGMITASRKRLDAFGHPFKYESALDHMTVAVSDATLLSFDAQTKKATCKATITYSFSGKMDALVRANQERGISNLALEESQYSVQPSADGSRLVYDFEGMTADYPGYVIQQLNELESRGQLQQG
ncbi:MAG TPA: hypothetical protein VGG48_00875 [Rhizomicrobium sp.]